MIHLDAQMDELRVYSTVSAVDVNAIYGGGNGETPVTAPVISVTASATVGQDFFTLFLQHTNVLFGAYNLPVD